MDDEKNCANVIAHDTKETGLKLLAPYKVAFVRLKAKPTDDDDSDEPGSLNEEWSSDSWVSKVNIRLPVSS